MENFSFYVPFAYDMNIFTTSYQLDSERGALLHRLTARHILMSRLKAII